MTIQDALRDKVDTGNAINDAFENVMVEHDPFEFECALVGIPETVDGEFRDIEYFLSALRASYLAEVSRLEDAGLVPEGSSCV